MNIHNAPRRRPSGLPHKHGSGPEPRPTVRSRWEEFSFPRAVLVKLTDAAEAVVPRRSWRIAVRQNRLEEWGPVQEIVAAYNDKCLWSGYGEAVSLHKTPSGQEFHVVRDLKVAHDVVIVCLPDELEAILGPA